MTFLEWLSSKAFDSEGNLRNWWIFYNVTLPVQFTTAILYPFTFISDLRFWPYTIFGLSMALTQFVISFVVNVQTNSETKQAFRKYHSVETGENL